MGLNHHLERLLKMQGLKIFDFMTCGIPLSVGWLWKAGTVKDFQELLGPKTMTMTLRYARLSQHHKKKVVNLLNGLTAKSSVSQKPDWWKATICKLLKSLVGVIPLTSGTTPWYNFLVMVGARRFELPTPWTPFKCANQTAPHADKKSEKWDLNPRPKEQPKAPDSKSGWDSLPLHYSLKNYIPEQNRTVA